MKWIAVVSLLWTSLAFAEDPPIWSLNPPKDDASYRYYVGRAIDRPNDAQAIKEATNNAMEQAIRDNFGVTMKFQNQSYETTKETSLVIRATEESKSVVLKDFTVIDTKLTKSEKGFSAWILYKYSKAAIHAESARLKSISKTAMPEFSEQSAGSILKGRIEIVTEPSGVTVNIDGKEVLGKTPLRLTGMLETGKHTLVIDHPDYEIVQEDFIISGGKTIRIKKILVPAKGTLNIESNPSGANVLANGEYVGATPIQGIVVHANEPIKLTFIHSDADVISVDVTVARDELKEHEQSLPLKKAKLRIIVSPIDSEVTIDGDRYNKGWVTLDQGTHNLIAKRDGYEPIAKDVELRGNEQRTEKLQLTSISKWQKHLEVTPFIVGVGYNLEGTSYRRQNSLPNNGIAFSFEKKFGRNFGARIEATMFNDSKDISGGGGKWEASGMGLDINPRYYHSSIFVGALYGRSRESVGCNYNSGTFGPPPTFCENFTINQSRYGANLGYQVFGERWGFEASYTYKNNSDDGAISGQSTHAGRALLLYRF